MPNNKIQIAKIYEPLITSDYKNFILKGGRASGKTKHTNILAGIRTATNPNEDIVICRASYGSIADSVYNETCEVIDSIEDFEDKFLYRKSPLRIIRKENNATIYFLGIGGSIDRTKGFKPKRKIGLVIIEETQELDSQEQLDQTLATLRRNMSENCVVVIVFNPPAQQLHWINVWAEQKKLDNDWCVIHSSYLDVLEFLNDRDVKEIRKAKFINEDYYNYMYLGLPSSFGGVYPMFRKDIHLIPYEKRNQSRLLQDFRTVACIIGCDGAVTHDATALVPRFIYSNGQSCAGKIYYHNPLTDGVKGSYPLVETEITRWFKELREENELDNPYDFMNSVPIVFVVDSAATELIQALNYFFGNRAVVVAIKKGTILQMVDVVQSAIGKNVVGVYDYGGYFNYTQNKWIKAENLLATQYQMLKWNDKQTGYDPTIPNDVSDADTYGIYYYFRQAENINWLSEIVNITKQKDYYILKK